MELAATRQDAVGLEVVVRFPSVSVMFQLALVATIGNGMTSARSEQQAAGLTIVVIQGEDAVNIIQQKTAVAPVVEVRDRNGQPAAGAAVKFAIQGGRATFGGARTLTMTTNVAGRAAASGLTPTASGALRISASVAFEGQTAAVTITQTNVLTAAQAATVAGAGGSGSAGGAGAASSAGAGSAGVAAAAGVGVSAATIGLVAAAAGGGAVAATQLGGDSAAGSSTRQATFEISNQSPEGCANLNNVRAGQAVVFQQGIGRWPTPAEKDAALAGQYAVISLDDLPLTVYYEGTTWHDGGGTPGGYGDRARANWVATSGSHVVTAMWTNQRQAASCAFAISR